MLNEDDVIEGVFLLKASTENVFFNRKKKFQSITGFSGEAFEEDEDGGIWKLIATNSVDELETIKISIEEMKKYKWFFDRDSDIMLNGKYIFSSGEWI